VLPGSKSSWRDRRDLERSDKERQKSYAERCRNGPKHLQFVDDATGLAARIGLGPDDRMLTSKLGARRCATRDPSEKHLVTTSGR